MLKHFLLVIGFIVVLFGNNDFLEPEQAFKTSIKQSNKAIVFDLNLAKDIYIYDEQLKVEIKTDKVVDITSKLNIRKPIDFHDFLVHFDSMNIEVPISLIQTIAKDQPYEVIFSFQGCSSAGLCYQPMSKVFKAKPITTIKKVEKVDKKPKEALEQNESDSIAQTLKDGNIFIVLGTFFIFGLLLALTPCVFPMIPILSSIIVSHSGDGKSMSAKKGMFLSLIYVLAMSVAYTIAGVLAGLFGANLQAALQNPVVLVIFAAVFVALAFSMFGYFKLELPQSWQNRLNRVSQNGEKKQGYSGIAIMGFLSALIVGPCVAPPLAGALVYIGQTGDALLGGAALFVMSLGMGAPLLLVGAGAGKFMPKPGGWMDTVSKVFGVVMLGVAIWMLERIIPAMATMILWSLLFIGSSWFVLKSSNNIIKIFGFILFAYGFILALGAGSGSKNPINPLEYIGTNTNISHGLEFKRVKTLQELDDIVKNTNKPIMLDFYADWCISCKELEESTFKDKNVINMLKDFTLLQVDTTKNTQYDKDLLKRFNLFGPPGIIFWDKNGKEIDSAKLVGYKNSKEFIEHIKRYYK
jgi:thiol:disulfide interchange protein DsbD